MAGLLEDDLGSCWRRTEGFVRLAICERARSESRSAGAAPEGMPSSSLMTPCSLSRFAAAASDRRPGLCRWALEQGPGGSRR